MQKGRSGVCELSTYGVYHLVYMTYFILIVASSQTFAPHPIFPNIMLHHIILSIPHNHDARPLAVHDPTDLPTLRRGYSPINDHSNHFTYQPL